MLSYGSIVLAAQLWAPEVVLGSSGQLKLPLLWDVNTTWQFVVTFPLLVAFLHSERAFIPAQLAKLVHAGSLHCVQDGEPMCEDWQTSYRLWNIVAQIVGVPCGFLAAYGNYVQVTRVGWTSWQAPYGHVNAAGWVWMVWFAVFYCAVTVYIARALVTVFFLRAVARDCRITPVPFHTDHAGGLEPVGRIGLRNQYILAAAGINIVLLILVANQFESRPGDLMYFLVALACGVYVVFGPIGFLGPLLPFRQVMSAQKQRLLAEASKAVRAQHERIRAEIATQRLTAEDDAVLDRLLKYMRTAQRMPVWPFDLVTRRKFAAAYVVPMLTMVGSSVLNWLLSRK